MAVFNGTVEQIENTNNKVTSISNSSTDVQYPTAKAVYDFVAASAPEMEHGTWTPTFSTDFIASTEVCNCTYTILNEHEAYISMHIEGTAGSYPTTSAANLFTGFPVPIQESAGISMLPVGDVAGVEFADYKNPCIFVASSASMAQIGLTPNESFVIAVNGVITYA